MWQPRFCDDETSADDRKRKREAALTAFNRNGTIEGLASLNVDDACMFVKSQYNPFHKGILKTRPILKGSQRYQQKGHPKKRKVLFDEKTLKELEQSKKEAPPKRPVDEHNTPFHDVYHHLSSDDEDFLGREPRPPPAPPMKEEPHLHFHFNVQFNFTRPKATSRLFTQKSKKLTMEEGKVFKLMLQAKLPQTDDDMEEDGIAVHQLIQRASLCDPFFNRGNSPTPSSGSFRGSPNTTVLSQDAGDSESESESFANSSGLLQLGSSFNLGGFPFSSPDREPFIFCAPNVAVERRASFTYCSGETQEEMAQDT
eukprot:NODE_2658_length_1125_cov_16.212425_g2536_i0.p1 GENE.NODE_2658_length_1125_cov_16.212425_g2536_i0~~NODE_2658_length_1125_cov_16.212425_g2536_i0.p1  ORF type:complete len:312 (+),score=76.41 NODE_2658_length_1125_cov_16.212425_g2536_i0:48-983(+)